MFGIPGEVFWPTVAFGSIIMLVFGGVVLLRLFPKARAPDQPELDALNDLRLRLGELDQLQARVGELEERVDFTERLLATQREDQRPGLPKS
jgi:hypothetical protein